MYLNNEKKTEIFSKFGKGAKDTGSAGLRDHPLADSACR